MRAVLFLGVSALVAALCACGAGPEARKTAPPISEAVRGALARYRAGLAAPPVDHDCHTIVRRYDVRALLLLLGGGSGAFSRTDRLAEFIILTTKGCSWTRDPNVSIRFADGVMTIRQSPAAHRQIRRLLTLME